MTPDSDSAPKIIQLAEFQLSSTLGSITFRGLNVIILHLRNISFFHILQIKIWRKKVSLRFLFIWERLMFFTKMAIKMVS